MRKRAKLTPKNVHTFSVDIRILSEAILHRLELFDTIDSLGFLLRKHEAGKCLAELHAAWTMSHPTQTRAVPVDFPGDGIECTLGRSFFSFIRRSLDILLVCVIDLGL